MTFAEPIDAQQTPFVAAQVNFGHDSRLVAARFEIFAITGDDDGSPLPESIIATLKTPAAERTAADAATQLRAYFSAHAPAIDAAPRLAGESRGAAAGADREISHDGDGRGREAARDAHSHARRLPASRARK